MEITAPPTLQFAVRAPRLGVELVNLRRHALMDPLLGQKHHTFASKDTEHHMPDQTITMSNLGANYQLRIRETQVCKADERDKEMRKFPENSKPLPADTTRHLADLLHGGHRMRSYRIDSPLAAELKNDTQQCIDFITQLEQYAQKMKPVGFKKFLFEVSLKDSEAFAYVLEQAKQNFQPHTATQSVGGVSR